MITAIIILSLILIATLVALIIVTRACYLAKAENGKLQQTLHALEDGYRHLTEVNDALHEERHDHQNQLALIAAMPADEAILHVQKLLNTQSFTDDIHTGDHTLDAILAMKLSAAHSHSIRLDYAVSLPGPIPLSSVDLCTIVCNLLDNAIEAASRIPDSEDRFIRFTVDRKKDFLLFIIENSMSDPGKDKLSLNSTKPAESGAVHGYGIKSVQTVVERLGGHLSFASQDTVFTCKAMVQVP